MSRLFHSLGFLLVVLPLAAQVPDWYDAASRKMHYPPEAWYTGFVVGELQEGETIEDAYARLKNEARAELVSTIRTSVEQNVSNRTQSVLRQTTSSFDERITETYISDTRIHSEITDIPGLKIEAWRNEDGAIVAFAYMKKTTLMNYLVKRITLGLAKSNSAIELAESLFADGHKSEARKEVKKGKKLLQEVEDAQSLLAIVDDTADEETLQYTLAHTLQQRLGMLEQQLKNAIMVYIKCTADLFGRQYTALAGKIKGDLSPLGVTFVSSPEQSDWAVYVSANAREYNSQQFGNVVSYTAYVEATVAIDKTATSQRIYEEQLNSEKGVHTISFAEAAREAYTILTPRICAIITEQIQR